MKIETERFGFVLINAVEELLLAFFGDQEKSVRSRVPEDPITPWEKVPTLKKRSKGSSLFPSNSFDCFVASRTAQQRKVMRNLYVFRNQMYSVILKESLPIVRDHYGNAKFGPVYKSCATFSVEVLENAKNQL